MRFLLILSLASMALASPLATSHLTARDEVFPQCATDCQSQVIARAVTKCSADDIPCLCADEAFQGEVASCVMKHCTGSEGLMAKHLSSKACGIITKPLYAEVDAGTLIPFLFASFFFSIRIASKVMHLGGGWGPDDYTISVAYVLAIVIYTLHTQMIRYGFGKNIWDILPQEDITIAFKVFFAYVLVYKSLISLAKISVGLFLLRIFRSTAFRYATYAIIAINAAIGITWILVDAFHCIPVHLAWTSWRMEETGTCIDFMTSTYVNGFVNIVVDTIMVSMPVYEVVKLKLDHRKKVGVAVMFGMGLLLTAIGIVRVIILFQHDPTKNPTYEMAPLNYWSMIECQIAIVCACLPAIRTLLMHFVPAVFGQATEAASQKRVNPSSDNSKGDYTSSSTLVESGDGYISKTMTYSVNTTIKSESSPSEPSINLVQIDRRRV
ncbi:integral membrane protein [Nannizzia gypsea CBS 118893]|uniref:Integral membrane protein n=1 Tax=Arthroderma gypseum (strain ATCC MYA-4604 / CBS 118893) TaxID=535722 RepID=E4V0N7_ARTGP|nr:integral membrane protein [Nannizzia gypsea CBS 118893]EFR03174.1 integral membrane protein [Nannizzia gypsea CBS 118893]